MNAPSSTRLGLLPALVLLGACAQEPAPETAASTAPPEIATEALSALHDSVRVEGLEDRRFDHETYWRIVEPYVGARVQAVGEGQSAEGRALRHLAFGSGPVTVLLWSQMHGDESTATMALADLVRFFHERGDHPAVERMERELTVHLVPMLNPDGAERFRRRNAQGVDVNRDARRLQTPEGRFLKAVVDSVAPDFGFNLHDQSPATRVGDTDRGVAIALLAPAFNEAREVDDKRRRAMQVASLLVAALDPLVGGHVARYDDTFNPRAFGDLVGAWGSSTVLIESGGWAGDAQKQHLRKANFVGLVAALDAMATGDWRAFTPQAYEALPENGRRMPDLLVRGGTVAVSGLPPLEADLLVNYGQPLLAQEGTIADLGDLGDVEAQDTLDATGLFVIPLAPALGEDGALNTGRPAHFLLAEDREGQRVRMRFEGGRPPA